MGIEDTNSFVEAPLSERFSEHKHTEFAQENQDTNSLYGEFMQEKKHESSIRPTIKKDYASILK